MSLAINLNSRASVYFDQERYDKALAHFEQSLVIYSKIYKTEENFEISDIYAKITRIFLIIGKNEEAFLKFKQWYEIKKRIGMKSLQN